MDQYDNQAFVDPGPLDPHVLKWQDKHRSRYIWAQQEVETIRFRCGPEPPKKLDVRIQSKLLDIGFYGVYKLGFFKYDWHLLEALVERWRPETHSFHLPVGEMTITLQDVGILCGLPIDGDPVISSQTHMVKLEWVRLCHELLGITPHDGVLKGGRLSIKYIIDELTQWEELPANAPDELVNQYTRAYILICIGSQLMPDTSNVLVKLMYLPLLRDVDKIVNYSWGSAMLAFLYRDLCAATKPDVKSCAGFLTIVQLWAWERLLCVRPVRTRGDVILQEALSPYGCRWQCPLSYMHLTVHNLRGYRDQLALLTEDQVEWQPYLNVQGPPYCFQGQAIWRAKVPLICFDRVEWHLPDRVMRQFGMLQNIPDPHDTSDYLHRLDRRGRSEVNWVEFHMGPIGMWNQRANLVVVVGQYGTEDVDYTHSYMLWYYRVTRLLIQNPNAIEDEGYRAHASRYEGLIQQLQRAYISNENAISEVEGYGIRSQNLYVTRGVIRQSLSSIRQQKRLDALKPPPPPVDRVEGVPQRRNWVRRRAQHVQDDQEVDAEEAVNEGGNGEEGNDEGGDDEEPNYGFNQTHMDYTPTPPPNFGFTSYGTGSGSGSRRRSVDNAPSPHLGTGFTSYGSGRGTGRRSLQMDYIPTLPPMSLPEATPFGHIDPTQVPSSFRETNTSGIGRVFSRLLRRGDRQRNPPNNYTTSEYP